MTRIAESPEILENTPCSAFLEGLPASWDESHLLEGEPGCFATFARRKGEAWYVASICCVRARTASIDFSFLGEGRYTATLYTDGMSDLHAEDVPIGAMAPNPKEQFDAWEKTVSRPTSHIHDLHLCEIKTLTVSKGDHLDIPCLQDGGFAMKLEPEAK